MNIKRIMLAAPKSGSGKTTVTCALLQCLKDDGVPVSAVKCGPDYIDPMFHRTVLGVPSANLDTFFTGKEETGRLFLCGRSGQDFVVMEGVMGLFDGLGGVREEGSSYDLAKVTKTPVILVVDAKGMGQSVIPLIAGFLLYDPEHLIKGVILNRTSKMWYEKIRPEIEARLPVSVVGYFPDDRSLTIESRHLGLHMPGEIDGIREKIKRAADTLRETVSLNKIAEIAEGDCELEEEGEVPESDAEHMSEYAAHSVLEDRPVLAVARDEAFCFYYEENLRLLEACGARLVFFSPLHDHALPAGVQGLLLGGGYPELYAKELSENTEMLLAVRTAFADGLPVLAECGGFLYLHSFLEAPDKTLYRMAGILPGTCRNTGKLVRFGYVELEEKVPCFLPEGGRIRGHEFHYYDSTDNGADWTAVKPVGAKSYPCMIADERCCLGFPHLYYPSNPEFIKRFVDGMRRFPCNLTGKQI